jgi:hypothetical protein
MKTGKWDLVTEGLKGRMTSIRQTIHEDFKGVKPYRKEPVSTEEQVAKYISYPDEVKQQLRQTIPQWNDYEAGILKKMEGLKK